MKQHDGYGADDEGKGGRKGEEKKGGKRSRVPKCHILVRHATCQSLNVRGRGGRKGEKKKRGGRERGKSLFTSYSTFDNTFPRQARITDWIWKMGGGGGGGKEGKGEKKGKGKKFRFLSHRSLS